MHIHAYKFVYFHKKKQYIFPYLLYPLYFPYIAVLWGARRLTKLRRSLRASPAALSCEELHDALRSIIVHAWARQEESRHPRLRAAASLCPQVGSATYTTCKKADLCRNELHKLVQTTEEWLNKEYELIEFDSYPNIRRQGFIMDMFYSNAGFGKSQWTEMDTKGIYVQSPGTLYMEPTLWRDSGMQPKWLLRISIMNPVSGDSCKWKKPP